MRIPAAAKKHSRAYWDLALLALLGASVFILSVVYDAFDRFVRWYAAQKNTYEIEEFLIMFFVLAFAAGVFSYRRWREGAREIAERILAEKALRESERRFRAVSELTSDFSFSLIVPRDRALQVDWVTDAVYDITGFRPEEFPLYAQPETLVHPDDLPAVLRHQVSTLSGDSGSIEYRIRQRGGAVRWVKEYALPIGEEGGERIVGILGAVQDITVRKQAELEICAFNEDLEQRVEERTAELQAVIKGLESFSYSVAHDLRTPLRSLAGFSQILAEDYAGRLDEAGRDCLQRIRSSSGRMAELIDGLLSLSRVVRHPLVPEPIDLSALVRTLRKQIEEEEPARRVSWAIEENVQSVGDGHLLAIALGNLVRNAWKFTGRVEQPRIAFGEVHDGTQRIFFVQDNGAGFDIRYADRLFEAFQRLHVEEEFPGTGIGLAIVQRIIQRHGGRIWAESQTGAGAVFYFTLTEAAARPATSQPRGEGGGSAPA